METFPALLALCQGNPLTKDSDVEIWCFLWDAPEKMIEQTIETPVIWDPLRSLWRDCNGGLFVSSRTSDQFMCGLIRPW